MCLRGHQLFLCCFRDRAAAARSVVNTASKLLLLITICVLFTVCYATRYAVLLENRSQYD